MNLRNISSEYCYLTELHAHSRPVSECGNFSADEVVTTYLMTGINTLTLTNHLTEAHLVNRHEDELAEFYLSDYYKAVEAAEGTGLNIALGVEIRFTETTNDYLVYGVSPDDIRKIIPYVKTDIQTFYREFKNEYNVIIQAHPFRDNMQPPPLGYVDGVETFNCHPVHNPRIPFACRFARENDLLVTGGSDYHEKGGHATCILRTNQELKNSFDIAQAIKSRDVIFDVFGHTVIPYM